MDIKKYLDEFTLPDNVSVSALTICADLDKNVHDLQELFDKIKPSSDSIHFVSYEGQYKHITNVTKLTKHIQKSIQRLDNKKNKNGSFFKNCIICKFNRTCIKIFKTGTLHLTAYNDSDIIYDNVQTILSILEANILHIKIAAVNFIVRMKSIDLTNLNFDNDDIKLQKNFTLNCSKTLKYKKDVTCNVFPKSMIGYAKSHSAIEEFIDIAKDYITFDDKGKEEEDDSDNVINGMNELNENFTITIRI